MSVLKIGQLCVTVGGSGRNDGRIVRVLDHPGQCECDPSMVDVYSVEAVSGRPLWTMIYATGEAPQVANTQTTCFVERARLRPLVDLRGGEPLADRDIGLLGEEARERRLAEEWAREDGLSAAPSEGVNLLDALKARTKARRAVKRIIAKAAAEVQS